MRLKEKVAIVTDAASIDMARCISHMAYLSNTVHPAFTHIVRMEREPQ